MPILSSYPEEPRPLPDVEKVACRDEALLIHFSRLQVGKDQMNPSQKIGFMESMNRCVSFPAFPGVSADAASGPWPQEATERTFLVAGVAGIMQVLAAVRRSDLMN